MLQFKDSGWTGFLTTVGPVAFSWTPAGLQRLTAGEQPGPDSFAPETPLVASPRGPVAQVVKRLQAHLKGKTDSFADVPVDLQNQSPFARTVLAELRRVPAGQSLTYGELATRAGRPGAARAVGRIMAANPVPIVVPCHRCLGADGALTGFSTAGGILQKAWILHLEGHVFDEEHEAGLRHLARRDPVMRKIIKICPPFRPLPDRPQPPWDNLLTAIIHQQLAVKAGRTIAGRVRALTPGKRYPTPGEMVAFSDEELRAVGLSGQKSGYVKDLAARVLDGSLKLNGLRKLSDDQVIEQLVQVRGIGVWSAQMHLIFHLGRLDVLPVGDLGLQIAAARAYGLKNKDGKEYATPAQLEELGEKWRPYRSLASWYLWRSLDQGGL
jgi:O-6-methylguanine DNA methyltransferase